METHSRFLCGTEDTAERGRRFPELDGLRAVFCVGIVLYHVRDSFDAVFSPWLDPVYHYGGYFGNYMFFILSGFLMAYHYKERLMRGECRFGAFVGRRICKVYPMFFFSNLAILFLGGTRFTVKRTIATFLMGGHSWFAEEFPYNHPAWFLCVLVICYVLYGLIGAAASRQPRLYLPLCAFFAAWGMLLEKAEWRVPLNYRACGEGYMNFFLGVLLAELLLRETVNRRCLLAVSCGGLCAALAGVCVWGMENVPGDMRWWISVICAALVCIAVYGTGPVRILAWGPLSAIGRCGFSIYLWHIPAVWGLSMLERSFGFVIADQRCNFLLYVLLLAVVSGVSYCIFEGDSAVKEDKGQGE